MVLICEKNGDFCHKFFARSYSNYLPDCLLGTMRQKQHKSKPIMGFNFIKHKQDMHN